MSLYKPVKSGKTLVKVSVALMLFFGASLLDFKLAFLTIYPIYLVSILYASRNFGFFTSIPISAIAAYLSIHSDSADTAYFVHLFLVRFTLFFIISYLFSAYMGLINTYRLRFELLKTMVPQCPDCGAIFCNDRVWRSLKEITGRPELLGPLPKHECEIQSNSLLRDISKE